MNHSDPRPRTLLVGFVCLLAVPVYVLGFVAFREALDAGAPPGPALEVLAGLLAAFLTFATWATRRDGRGGPPPSGITA